MRLHAGGIAGRDRHHRRPDRTIAASGANGARPAADQFLANNFKQLGIVLQNFHDSNNQFPAGSIAKAYPEGNKSFPQTFYRWSAFAALCRFSRQGNAVSTLDMSVPLYGPTGSVSTQNATAINYLMPMLLCPSDIQEAVDPAFAPTNYAMCSGTGTAGGDPRNTDGVFYVNSATRIADIIDGTSQTIAASESLLGTGQISLTDATQVSAQRDYSFFLAAPLSDALCAKPTVWNVSNRRGFAWVSGEIRSATYNHYYPPNYQGTDCMGVSMLGDPTVHFTPYGWRCCAACTPAA